MLSCSQSFGGWVVNKSLFIFNFDKKIHNKIW
jgi:hypothetical protein